MAEILSNWGGPRENAGRNIVPDKKKQVRIGIKESIIKKLGGEKKVQEIMQKAIDNALKKS